jgi:transcription elongation GreA/GreB family factor
MASSKDPEQRNVAEAKKAIRDRDAQIATREYHAEKARVDANTARLRELRLAREAAEVPAAAVKSTPAKKKAAARVANPARRGAQSRTRT